MKRVWPNSHILFFLQEGEEWKSIILKFLKLEELKELSLRSSIRTGVKDDSYTHANKKSKVTS